MVPTPSPAVWQGSSPGCPGGLSGGRGPSGRAGRRGHAVIASSKFPTKKRRYLSPLFLLLLPSTFAIFLKTISVSPSQWLHCTKNAACNMSSLGWMSSALLSPRKKLWCKKFMWIPNDGAWTPLSKLSNYYLIVNILVFVHTL